jgi:hypothetical protein
VLLQLFLQIVSSRVDFSVEGVLQPRTGLLQERLAVAHTVPRHPRIVNDLV